MSKRSKKRDKSSKLPPAIQLPKDRLSRVNLGQAFAQYDEILLKPGVMVRTAAVEAALDPNRSRLFFVGRRGTGKTAIARHVAFKERDVVSLQPEIFSPFDFKIPSEELTEVHQRGFRSLITAFRLALTMELLASWLDRGHIDRADLPPDVYSEVNPSRQMDFDLRALDYITRLSKLYADRQERRWLQDIKRPKYLATVIGKLDIPDIRRRSILIDGIDESWNGSDAAVIYLTALMHACLETSTQVSSARVLLFVRENVFERVRAIDTEFARLETAVVGVDWTRPQLVELVERRLALPFSTRLPLGGPTWNAFFETGEKARDIIFDYCQFRPRDVLIYCSFAIEAAYTERHAEVHIRDLMSARRRFSDSRLSDLGDEYVENFPGIPIVLNRFFGLGTTYTLGGLEDLISRLLLDDEVKKACANWIYQYQAPQLFAQLMWDIGFFGLSRSGETIYRSPGPQSTTPPALTKDAYLIVHPTYHDALELQDIVISSIAPEISLRSAGLIGDVPGSVSMVDYRDQLKTVIENLKTLPEGDEHADEYQKLVGEVLRLCFHRVLVNLAPQKRDYEGRVIRDWIASNRAIGGFWEMIRQRYDATQVLWECKNYKKLSASDFHQVAYYMVAPVGRFCVFAFRGKIENHYYGHIRRIASDKDGLVLLLSDKDLQVFLRQAMKGDYREAHIQNRFDEIQRAVS